MNTQLKAARAAARAKQAQRIAEARTALEAYWAGSAVASVAADYEAGAVRIIKVEG